MNDDIEPQVDGWYRDLVSNRVFQVVEVDLDEELVELQHSDGDLEEMSLEEWATMDLEATDAPDDWVEGPLDGVEADNLDLTDVRSVGEGRARAETERSAFLQSDADSWEDDDIIERSPEDEASESDAVEGTEREARRQARRTRQGDDDGY